MMRRLHPTCILLTTLRPSPRVCARLACPVLSPPHRGLSASVVAGDSDAVTSDDAHSSKRSASTKQPPRPVGYWRDPAHRRAFLASVAAALGFAEHDYAAWARVRVATVRELGGASLLRYYAGSLRAVLADAYPDHAWHAPPLHAAVLASASITHSPASSQVLEGVGRVRVARHYWASRTSHEAFVRAFAAARGRDVHDVGFWYGVSAEALRRAGGASVLRHYAGSVARLVTTLFPQLPWEPARFHAHARAHAHDAAHDAAPARTFLDRLAHTLQLGSDHSAWYGVTTAMVRAHGGGALLQLHGNSLAALLQHAYPEHAWERARFVHKPQRFWRDPANVRAFLLRLAEGLGLPATPSAQEWYALQASDLRRHGGAGLLHAYGGSVAAVLAAAFPEHTWHADAFVTRPRRHWADPAHQRAFLDALAQRLGLAQPADWYAVTAATVRAHGGRALLQRYGGSLHALLATVYPEHTWHAEAFVTTPRGVWSSAESQRKFLDTLAPRLGFPAHALESWYNVSVAELTRFGGGGLRVRWQGSLAALLCSAYPEHPWDVTRFARTPKLTRVARPPPSAAASDPADAQADSLSTARR